MFTQKQLKRLEKAPFNLSKEEVEQVIPILELLVEIELEHFNRLEDECSDLHESVDRRAS